MDRKSPSWRTARLQDGTSPKRVKHFSDRLADCCVERFGHRRKHIFVELSHFDARAEECAVIGKKEIAELREDFARVEQRFADDARRGNCGDRTRQCRS